MKNTKRFILNRFLLRQRRHELVLFIQPALISPHLLSAHNGNQINS